MRAVKECMRCNAKNDSEQKYCVKCGRFLSARAAGHPKNKTIWDMELTPQLIGSSEPQPCGQVICPQCRSVSAAVDGVLPLACDQCGYFFQAGIDDIARAPSSDPQIPDVKKNPIINVGRDTSYMRFIAVSRKDVPPEEADVQGGIIGDNGTVMRWIRTSQQMSFRHTPAGWYIQVLAGQPLYNGVPVNTGAQIRLSDGDMLTIEKEQIRVEIVRGKV